jgi:hypothetical protein
MYRYKLLKNGEQVTSSNNKMLVKSWMIDDRRHSKNWDAKYEIVDGLKEGTFDPRRRALND